MTKGFTRFNFQGATAGPESIELAEEFSFASATPQQVSKASKNKLPHFSLDHLVAEQLGLGKMEQEQAEKKIKNEIDRRWQITKEQAEVAGYTAGLEEGKKAAYESELPRIQEKIDKLDHFLQECDKFREKLFLANETFLMDLIAQVAKMVVLKEVEVDKDYLRRVILALLNQIGTKEDIKIFISEADLNLAEQLKQAVEKEFGKLSNTVLESHPEVQPGGCKIETRFGVIDANIQVQIENIMKALKN